MQPKQPIVEVLPPGSPTEPQRPARSVSLRVRKKNHKAKSKKKDLDANKPEGISERLKRVLELIANKGLNQSQAAAVEGMDGSHVCRMLSRPEVRDYLTELQSKHLLVLRSKALVRTEALIDTARSERVQLEASRLVLEQTQSEDKTGDGDIELVFDLG